MGNGRIFDFKDSLNEGGAATICWWGGAPEWGGRDVSLGWGLEQSQGRTPVSALE